SEVAGIPVALLGMGFSGLVALLQLVWWRRGARPALFAGYGIGLFGLLFVAYLTYLELFVIGAVCVWCVTYAATVVIGWAIAALALRGAAVADYS
ncbi:MAG: vitamin K epoxide reductase family protein, partial [Candidatus Limnocylindrales bacterium]